MWQVLDDSVVVSLARVSVSGSVGAVGGCGRCRGVHGDLVEYRAAGGRRTWDGGLLAEPRVLSPRGPRAPEDGACP